MKSNRLLILSSLTILIFLSCQIFSPNLASNPANTPDDSQPSNLEPTLPVSRPGPTSQVGFWEIALSDSSILPDYNGNLPMEGHKFHQLTLFVLNTSNVPQLFYGNSLGSFEAKWEDYTYNAQAIESIDGYIPPGWPVQMRVIFDLPIIAENQTFTLEPSSFIYGELEPIDLETIGSNLSYQSPQIHKLGEEFKVPERISVTPTNMRSVLINQGDFTNHYMLMLDASIKNLYGHDILVNQESLVFQLFAPGQIIPVSESLNYYYLPGASPDYSFRWFSPSPEGGDINAFQLATDSTPLAPGFSKDGSFWMNIWGQSQPSLKMLLLVMYAPRGNTVDESTPWALYEIDQSASDLIKSPIAPLDETQIALNEAHLQINQGNWVAASILLGRIAKNHPANDAVLTELQAAQQKAGKLVFSAPSSNLLLRNIGSGDDALITGLEVNAYQSGNTISPNGKYLAFMEEKKLAVVELKEGQEVSRKYINIDYGGVDNTSFLTWSPNSEKIALTVKYLWRTQGNIVVIDINTDEIKYYLTCGDLASHSIRTLALSNDGQKIALESSGTLFYGQINDSNCNSIIDDLYYAPPLAWSLDGNTIYFSNGNQLFSASIANSQVSLTPLSPLFPHEIRQIFLAPDNRHLVIMVNFIDTLYILDLTTLVLYEDIPSEESLWLIGWIP
jgi:hypothetical protein